MRIYSLPCAYFLAMFIRNRPLNSLKNHPPRWLLLMNIAEKPLDLDQMPSDPAKRWEWIKYQLRIHGCSPAELARQLDITDSAIRAVKQTPYPRIERAIALKLGVEPKQLWPERWNPDGSPRRRRPNRAESTVPYHSTERAKDSRYAPVSHRITGARV